MCWRILAGIAWLAGFQIFLIAPADAMTLLILIGVYGAAANGLYAIVVAHANDFAKPEDFVKVSGGLLLLYGIGTIIGPTISGPIMSQFGPYALFGITSAAHIMIAVYAIVRSRLRAAIPVDERENYSIVATNPAITHESLSLDPRGARLEDETPDENISDEEQAA